MNHPRYDEITGKTRIYAHLAHPSSHVRTPQTFNVAFHQRKLDILTVSVDVTPDNLRAFMLGVRGWINLAGLGVTIPHKQAVIVECDGLVGLARQIKAVNVIRREPDGKLIGTNTDGAGFVAALHAEGRDPRGAAALIVGTGGAGRAIAFALANAQVRRLTLANRTQSTAEDLAQEIAALYPELLVSAGDPDPRGYDLVVNASSLGMRRDDPLPVDPTRLDRGASVADIVMSPPRTRLLKAAEMLGCTIHPGITMLTSQIDMVIEFLEPADAAAMPMATEQ